MMLDTWKGNLYAMDGVSGDGHWKLLMSLEPKDDNKKEKK